MALAFIVVTANFYTILGLFVELVHVNVKIKSNSSKIYRNGSEKTELFLEAKFFIRFIGPGERIPTIAKKQKV